MKNTSSITQLKPKGQPIVTRALGILVLVLLALNGLDMCLTIYAMSSGEAYEANPLLDSIYTRWGFEGFIAFKTLFVWILCLTLLVIRGNTHGRILALICVVVIYLVNVLLTISNMNLSLQTFLINRLPWLVP
jgi:hypothetical protein